MYNNKCFPITAAALCLASVIALSGCGDKNDREAVYVEKAKSSIENDNYEKAMVDVKNVLQINANNLDGRLLLAELQEVDKDWRGMYQNLLFVIDKDPMNYDANMKLVPLYVAMKKLDEAKLAAKILSEVDPLRSETYSSSALILFFEKNNDQADKQAKKALEISPVNLQALTMIVSLHEDSPSEIQSYITAALAIEPKNEAIYRLKLRSDAAANDIKSIREDLKALIDISPETVAYYEAYLKTYLSKEENDFDKVIEIVDSAIVANPEVDGLKFLRAEILIKARGLDSAIDYLTSLILSNQESFPYSEGLAKLYFNNEEPEKGMEVLQETIDYNPVGSAALSARLRLATIKLSSGDAKGGEIYIDEVLAIDSANLQANIIKAKLQLSRKEFDAATTSLRSALNTKGDSVETLLLLAGIYEHRNETLLALDSYKKAVSYEPKNLIVLVKLGTLQSKLGDKDMAERYLLQALEIQPKNVAAITVLASLYSSMEKWDEASKLLLPLEGDEKFTALTTYVRAKILLRKNDYKAAEPLLRQSIKANPGVIEPLTTLVQLLLSTERADEAEAFINSFITEHPDMPHAIEAQGMVYQIKGDIERAKTSYAKVVELQPAAVSSYMRLATIAMMAKDVETAEALYYDVVKNTIEPEKGELALAEFYRYQERYEESREMYRNVLKRMPNSVLAKNNYAVLLLDYFGTEKDLRESRELLIGFEESNIPAFLDTFGWLQYRLGNYTQAVSYLRLANSKGGTGVEFDYHLGMAYKASEMNEDAKKYLEAALADSSVKFKGRDEAVKALADL